MYPALLDLGGGAPEGKEGRTGREGGEVMGVMEGPLRLQKVLISQNFTLILWAWPKLK